jgi:hypothetical protein
MPGLSLGMIIHTNTTTKLQLGDQGMLEPPHLVTRRVLNLASSHSAHGTSFEYKLYLF